MILKRQYLKRRGFRVDDCECFTKRCYHENIIETKSGKPKWPTCGCFIGWAEPTKEEHESNGKLRGDPS